MFRFLSFRLLGVEKSPALPPPRLSFRPRLEALEGRVVLATLHVGAAETYHSIQAAVTAARPHDVVLVDPGTYQEQVTIGPGKDGLKLESTRPLAAVIQAPVALTGDGAIVEVQGARDVTIDGFTITGPNNVNPSPGLLFGVLVDQGGSATITHNHVTDIENSPLTGDQQGIGIQVGNNAENQSGSADIEQNLIDNYQKGGVVVEHAGSGAEIENNSVVGAGPTEVIAQNGIQVSDGAKADVSGNRVSGNVYTPAQTDPNAPIAAGILLLNPGKVGVIQNTVSNNDAGVYAQGATNAVVDFNTISRSTFYGIVLDGTSGASVAFNSVTGNGTNNTANVTDGIDLFDQSMNNTIDHNTSTQNSGDGVFVDATSSRNRLTYNTLQNNGMYDAEDDSVGSRTAGTANYWDDNHCGTDNKDGGLCQDHDQHAHHKNDGDDRGDA